MLKLQKIFLIVRFFNWISCNKEFKNQKFLFFLVFLLLNPPEAEMFQNQKTTLFLTSQAEEIWKSESMEHNQWIEIMVNVENRNFLKVNCEFLSGRGKRAKNPNDKKFCLSRAISQEPYIIWLSFMVHGTCYVFKTLSFVRYRY